MKKTNFINIIFATSALLAAASSYAGVQFLYDLNNTLLPTNPPDCKDLGFVYLDTNGRFRTNYAAIHKYLRDNPDQPTSRDSEQTQTRIICRSVASF